MNKLFKKDMDKNDIIEKIIMFWRLSILSRFYGYKSFIFL